MLKNLPALITLLIILSIATERFVEIIKGLSPWLDTPKPLPRDEGRRRAALQALAVLGGMLIAWLSHPVFKGILDELGNAFNVTIALGLLSSGGSGFWNTILGYVSNLKDLKGADAERTRQVSAPAAAVAILPHPTKDA